MSIRRRNVNTRLGRDLQYERGAHEMTRALLKASHDLVGKALAERDEARRQRDRLRDLALELAAYFTEPPRPLSRDSYLFELLQDITPTSIPVLPATPKDILEDVLDMAGVTMEDIASFVADAGSKLEEPPA